MAHAAPPAPLLVTLVQPDGHAFLARTWGDEWSNGMETVAGYTILQEPRSEAWVYAAALLGPELTPARDTSGMLVVGRDGPGYLPKHIRPVIDLASHPFILQAPAVAPAQASVNTGTQKLLVILVAFQDRGPVGTTEADWSDRIFGPAGSLRDYYDVASYGNLDIAPAGETSGVSNNGIINWLTLSMDHPNTGGNLGSANLMVVRQAILAADPYVNFGSYDADHDGYLSYDELHVMVVLAGYETAYGGSASCSPSVWGHQWTLEMQAPTVDGVRVASSQGNGGYTQFGEWHCELGGGDGNAATLGLIAHEFGHDLNLPDLYDTDGDTVGVGNWALMGTGAWNRTSSSAEYGNSPASHDPWSRWYEGWLTPVQVTASMLDVPIPQVETNPVVYQVLENPGGVDWVFNSHSGSGEYFLLENRQLVGYDAGLPGCGLLIWHIDETMVPDNSANARQFHRLVDLAQADGRSHLNTGTSNRGDAGDPFPGSSGNRAFNPTSRPNSGLYSGVHSGVSVAGISDCSATMTADIFLPAFADVPLDHWAWQWIQGVAASGVSNGCGEGNYCPTQETTRAQMAAFLLRASHGGDFTPPPGTGLFADVPLGYWALDWIEDLYSEGITTGCLSDPLSYCPEGPVTRAQMAVFLLRTTHGVGYTPPAAAGIFADVPPGHWAAPWIEALYLEGITTGCSTSPLSFCPEGVVTRAEMAVFLARTFSLPLP